MALSFPPLSQQNVRTFPEIFSEVPLVEEDFDDLFIMTNETGTEEVLNLTTNMPMTAGKVLLYTSGFFGLDLAATREGVEFIVSVDRSKKLPKLWEGVRSCILNNSREEAVTKIDAFIRSNAGKLFRQCHCCSLSEKTENCIERIHTNIESGHSWLSTDQKYKRILKIFSENKFVSLHADFCNEAAMAAIAKSLVTHRLSFDGIYLSNVKEYAEGNKNLEIFQRAIAHLQAASTPDTFIVDTDLRTWDEIEQRVPLRQRIKNGFHETDTAAFFPAIPGPFPDEDSSSESLGGGVKFIFALPLYFRGNVVVIDSRQLSDFFLNT